MKFVCLLLFMAIAFLIGIIKQDIRHNGSFPLTALGPGFSFQELLALDLQGKTFIVTGGNAGLGKVSISTLMLRHYFKSFYLNIC